MAYWPVAAKYGLGFLSFYQTLTYPDASIVLARATMHVWGLVGLLGIALALLVTFARRLAPIRITPSPSQGEGGGEGHPDMFLGHGATTPPTAVVRRLPVLAAMISVILYTVIYFRLPLESGYLTPAVPFVLLLLGRLLTRRAFQLVCVALCLSPYIGDLGRAGSAPAHTYSAYTIEFTAAGRPFTLDVLRGPVLHDYVERLHGMTFVERIMRTARTLPADSEIVVGYWLPQIQVGLGRESPPGVRFIYLLDAPELNRCRACGIAIYYLPEMAAFSREVHGLDLRQAGAIPLNLYWGE